MMSTACRTARLKLRRRGLRPGIAGTARRARRGLTLFETALWSVVAVVAIAGIIAGFVTLQANLRESQTSQLVQTLMGSVRGLYTASINYTGISAAVLVNAGDVPARFVRGTDIQSPEGGDITLAGWDGGFAIAVETDRDGTCITILSSFLGHAQLTGIATLATIPASITAATATVTTGHDTVAEINTACAANSNVVLEFS